MTWRTAYSLEQLAAEVRTISPQTVIYFIGDAAHQAEASDHNPNAAGVVCAGDFMQGFGLDLGALAEQVRQRKNPDLKYVIYNRRIASASSNPPWSWRTYTGSNPHTDHVHVSVGVGSDGRSVQPYDDRISWGVATTGGIANMLCKKGDKGDIVKSLQMEILAAGGSLPQFGPDGDYGNETAYGLIGVIGTPGADKTGNTYGPSEWAALKVAIAKHNVVAVTGPQGPTGPAGPQGPKGDPGANGTAAVLEVGTTLQITG